jgi:hypothetical protein
VPPEVPLGLNNVISTLADYKAFHETRFTVDPLLSPYCQKASEKKFRNSVTAKYTCDAASGLLSVKLNSTEQSGHRSYLMYLHISFPSSHYSAIRNLVGRQIGPATSALMDYARWEYNSDSDLNQLGHPVIYVSRDSDGKSATFAVALEQGESER